MTQAQLAEELAISSNYVSLLEAGKKRPSSNLEKLVGLMETDDAEPEGGMLREEGAPYGRKARMIPVLGWAHAGEAASYEELPLSWQQQVPTECPDAHAFALKLEGDSMLPAFGDGDLLVTMPGQEAYSGSFAVCRFLDGGVVFRRVEFLREQVQLVPLNDRYDVTRHDRDEFAWIYPVWGSWRQLWKK